MMRLHLGRAASKHAVTLQTLRAIYPRLDFDEFFDVVLMRRIDVLVRFAPDAATLSAMGATAAHMIKVCHMSLPVLLQLQIPLHEWMGSLRLSACDLKLLGFVPRAHCASAGWNYAATCAFVAS